MANIAQFLEHLKSEIPEISPAEALLAIKDRTRKALLIDIRETDETRTGVPAPALCITKGLLETQIGGCAPESDQEIILICASGRRSLIAAASLRAMGYKAVFSVMGGFQKWKSEHLPIAIPRILEPNERLRYSRHLLIPEIAEAGQVKLMQSKVLIVGAGGLGSPICLYLAAAGVGTIGIIDDDKVDRSNLQRQILHTDKGVGLSKAQSAKERINALNPVVTVIPMEYRLTRENIEEILSGYDLVVDGTDNFNTRYLVNDASVKLKIPNVHGAIFRFEGQVSVFWPASSLPNAPCYRCLFGEPTPAALAPNCAEAGVLGVLPGIVGTLCATEALKILLGIGNPLVGKVLKLNVLENDFEVLEFSRNLECRYCGCKEGEAYPEYSHYTESCTS